MPAARNPRSAACCGGAVLLLIVLLTGATRWPTGEAAGGPLVPPRPAAASTLPSATMPASAAAHAAAPARLKLAVLNIHSGIGKDDHWDLARTAGVLRGYDLISLHECRGPGPWWRSNVDDLAARLNMTGLFLPTEIWWWHRWFGNGLLTDTHVDRWRFQPLPTGFRMAYRAVTTLDVPLGDETLHVMTVHMAKKSDRPEDFAIVAQMFLSLPKPAILMGDMNTRPSDPMMLDLLRGGDVQDPVGQRLTSPRDRVDFVLTRGVRWRDAGLVENDASDHPLVWVEVEADK